MTTETGVSPTRSERRGVVVQGWGLLHQDGILDNGIEINGWIDGMAQHKWDTGQISIIRHKRHKRHVEGAFFSLFLCGGWF